MLQQSQIHLWTIYFAKHQKMVMKFQPQYLNTRIIQLSKQFSKNAILVFTFKTVSFTDVEKKMKSLDINKASHSSDIPTKILKQNLDFFSLFILGYVNKSVRLLFLQFWSQQTSLQYTRKIRDTRKVTIDLLVSYQIYLKLLKIFHILYDKISSLFENIVSKYQTGFRKDFNPQSCLAAMIEKCKKSLDQGGEYAALLTRLTSIRFFDLIITKLHAYGFDKASLRLTHSYLKSRYQRVKINNFYSLQSLIKYGVAQGSILCPILLNVFSWDIFLMIDTIDIASYADDNIPYSVGKN